MSEAPSARLKEAVPHHAIWVGRPRASTKGRFRLANDLADANDLHPDDIESLTVRVRGKLLMRRAPFNVESSAKMAEQVKEHGRKVLITVHLKGGSMVRYRGNGRMKGGRQ